MMDHLETFAQHHRHLGVTPLLEIAGSRPQGISWLIYMIRKISPEHSDVRTNPPGSLSHPTVARWLVTILFSLFFTRDFVSKTRNLIQVFPQLSTVLDPSLCCSPHISIFSPAKVSDSLTQEAYKAAFASIFTSFIPYHGHIRSTYLLDNCIRWNQLRMMFVLALLGAQRRLSF